MSKKSFIMLLCLFCSIIAIVGTDGIAISNNIQGWFKGLDGLSKALSFLGETLKSIINGMGKILKFFGIGN